MKIAYISSPEYGCPPPKNRIQAALWIAAQIIEGITQLGHYTVYIGVNGSKVGASKIISMGKGFHELYPYEEWLTFNEKIRIETFENYRNKLFSYAVDVLTKENVDLVHFHASPPIGHLPFAEYIKMPKLSTFHDPLYPEYIKLFQDYDYVKDNYYVTISNSQRQPIPDLNYAATIFNGIPINNYPFLDKPKKYLLHMGRIKESKGSFDAILVAQKAKIPIYLAGRYGAGDIDFIKKNIEPRVDSMNVFMTGVVDFNKKTELLGNAMALLNPIHWEEPFGLVMVEAMATGTPVVAFARGSVPEIVKDGETGFIVNFSDTDKRGDFIVKETGQEGLLEAIEKIYSMPIDKYKAMRRACRARVEKLFTDERMVADYERLYQKLL